MSAGIYEFFPNGRLMEIVNHIDCQVKFTDTMIAIPLSDEERKLVTGLKKIGFSEKEIFTFRHGITDKRDVHPEKNKEPPLLKIPLKALPKKQLLEIIENGLNIKIPSLGKRSYKDLLALARKVINMTQLEIVLVY